MKSMTSRVALVVSLLGLSNCGGGSPSSPSPTPPITQTNRAPVITSTTATPTFGIVHVQSFTFAATATDADGDALIYTWSIGGASATGPTTSGTFSSGGEGTATVTVNDGHGGTASGSVNFIVGTMAGTWTVTSGQLVGSTFAINHSTAGILTGTFTIPGIGSGTNDPAAPGSINGAGTFTLRWKIGQFNDFTMTGTLTSSGRLINGVLNGSGFSNTPFSMSK